MPKRRSDATSEDAVASVAAMAVKQKTGARGIRSIVESAMIDIMYEIPSITGRKKVVVTREVIEEGITPKIIELGIDTTENDDEADEVNQITA